MEAGGRDKIIAATRLPYELGVAVAERCAIDVGSGTFFPRRARMAWFDDAGPGWQGLVWQSMTWPNSVSSEWQVWFKRTTDRGLSWEPSIRLSDGSGSSRWPQLVAARDRLASAIWADRINPLGEWRILARRSLDSGGAWEPGHVEVSLSDAGAWQPTALFDGWSRRILVVWSDARDGLLDLYYSTSRVGETWMQPQRLLPELPDGHRTNPSIASDGEGKVFVAWEERVAATGSWTVGMSEHEWSEDDTGSAVIRARDVWRR